MNYDSSRIIKEKKKAHEGEHRFGVSRGCERWRGSMPVAEEEPKHVWLRSHGGFWTPNKTGAGEHGFIGFSRTGRFFCDIKHPVHNRRHLAASVISLLPRGAPSLTVQTEGGQQTAGGTTAPATRYALSRVNSFGSFPPLILLLVKYLLPTSDALLGRYINFHFFFFFF